MKSNKFARSINPRFLRSPRWLMWIETLCFLNLYPVTVVLFYGQCRAGSAFTYVQSDPPLHFPLAALSLTRCLFVKQSCPPYCHIDTESSTFHLLISKELIGKYQRHLRKEQCFKLNQFHRRYCMLLKDRNDNLIIRSYRSMLQLST